METIINANHISLPLRLPIPFKHAIYSVQVKDLMFLALFPATSPSQHFLYIRYLHTTHIASLSATSLHASCTQPPYTVSEKNK